MLDLERALGMLSFRISTVNQTPKQFAVQQEKDALAGQASVVYHYRQAETERYERIEEWRRKNNSKKGRK